MYNFRHLAYLLLSTSIVGGTVSWAQTSRDNPLLYEVLDRLQQLERELRQLRGDLEFFQHSQRRDRTANANPTSTVDADSGYNEDRLNNIEQRLLSLERALAVTSSSATTKPNKEPIALQSQPQARAASSKQPPAATTPLANVAVQQTQPSPVTQSVSGAEQDAYNLALSRLRAGRYQQSSSDFQTFINTYPASPLLSDAYFWLGESHYAKRDFEQAKQMFLLLGSRYPESDKLPDALLKLGYTYSELGDNDKARQVLQRLRSAFPGVPAANLAEKHLSRLP